MFGVSSQAIKETAFGTSRPLLKYLLRFPMGVATMYRVDKICQGSIRIAPLRQFLGDSSG